MSPKTNVNPLPELIIQKLSRKYMYMPDILMRLRTLQSIPKGKNIGALSRTTPHDNAVAFAEENDLPVYVGYLIVPDEWDPDPRIITHSFCVQNDQVVEPTAGIQWTPTVRYIGYPVPRSEHKNFLYLNKFNRLFL